LIGADGGAKDLEHKGRGLAGMKAKGDDEPAMVVHEGDQIDASVLALQDEGEEIGLPELVRTGALELSEMVLVARVGTSSKT